MHYRARSYDPRTGRFVQNDPIRDRIHAAQYLYASNQPQSRRDALGTQDVPFPADPPGERKATIEIHVLFQDGLGPKLLTKAIEEAFVKILHNAVSQAQPRVEVTWKFLRNRIALGKREPEPGRWLYNLVFQIRPKSAMLTQVELLLELGFDTAPPLAETSPGSFATAFFSDSVPVNMMLAPGGSTRDFLVANTLVHEIVYHGIGDRYDTKGKSETGNEMDLTRWQPVGEWAMRTGFLPPQTTTRFLQRIGLALD